MADSSAAAAQGGEQARPPAYPGPDPVPPAPDPPRPLVESRSGARPLPRSRPGGAAAMVVARTRPGLGGQGGSTLPPRGDNTARAGLLPQVGAASPPGRDEAGAAPLLVAASACIFLTLSLRLAPFACGLLLVFLHALTAVFATVACSGSFSPDGGAGAGRAHTAHTAGAVLTAIFQGAAALLAFTAVGEVILKLVGVLGTAIFVVEWIALALAFVLRLEDDDGCSEEVDGEHCKSWASGYHV